MKLSNEQYQKLTFLLIGLFAGFLNHIEAKQASKSQPEPDISIQTQLQILNFTNSLNCSSTSHALKLKYNHTRLTEVKHADFCSNFASRTCCSMDNLNALRIQFYRQVYLNIDLSNQCYQGLQHLVCYDCDGDVGQGTRQGLCPQQCESLYQICENDYFSVDGNGSLKVCSRTDLMCSKLRDIIGEKKTDFCKLLGYEINENSDYSDWITQFVPSDESEQKDIPFEPVCWNFEPSSKIFGPAPPNEELLLKEKKAKEAENIFKRSNDQYQTIIYALYGLLAFIIIASIVYLIFACRKMKNAQKRFEHIE